MNVHKPREKSEAYRAEQKTALDLISQLLDNGVETIILADDLAGDQAPSINPGDLDELNSALRFTGRPSRLPGLPALWCFFIAVAI